MHFMSEIKLTIPYPPSVNHSYGSRINHQRYLLPKVRQFRQSVLALFLESKQRSLGDDCVMLSLSIFPPDRRVRDIDNILKQLCDALQYSGMINNDKQIRKLYVEFSAVIKGGKVDLHLKRENNNELLSK